MLAQRCSPVPFATVQLRAEATQEEEVWLPEPTPRQAGAITLLLRWTYGSAFGIAHVWLRKRLREPAASLLFGSVLMAVTSVAFPVLGRTPVPWRWPVDAQLSSIGSHSAYIITASALDNILR